MPHQKIKKLLIANRAEIVLRIQRACRKLGIPTVTIASEVDKESMFARESEELVVIGPAAAAESYLAMDKIIAAALASKANAIHPGYGFLSENAEFAHKVREAGLIFVGPSAESIQLLGSKTEARKIVESHGIPFAPGAKGGLSDTELLKQAEKVGFPIVIKAVAGGGGRGMRVVHNAKDMREVLPLARSEAKKNFSSEDVYFEKFIERPRHVEVQVFGDMHGNVLHFGTRECSVQRRHQKLIEEAPAPALSDTLREKLHQAAVTAAKSVGYYNAGTVEFLVKGEDFYFLEINTRIQVEHPVTEEVTGMDLVELQLKVAEGEEFPFKQSEIRFSGHAMEFRIYAEDPHNNFTPSIGKMNRINRVSAPWIREDYGLSDGDAVTPFYDAMLSKVIVTGQNRLEVLSKIYSALRKYSVEGLKTNIEFHRWILRQRAFRRSEVDITWVEREFSAESLKCLEASEALDPQHNAPLDGLLYVERFVLEDAGVAVELVHEEGGTFLAKLRSLEGKMIDPRCWRRSNGRAAALKAVKEAWLQIVK